MQRSIDRPKKHNKKATASQWLVEERCDRHAPQVVFIVQWIWSTSALLSNNECIAPLIELSYLERVAYQLIEQLADRIDRIAVGAASAVAVVAAAAMAPV